ncbi:amidase, partial [termite gut metagenome]
SLKIIVEDKKLTGINVIGVEDYLTSVISSEMSATASLELLKAHAVISRSWLLANLDCLPLNPSLEKETTKGETVEKDTIIRWYDRTAHLRYHVCADDHCQRYQGTTRTSTSIVCQAIGATRGQVIMYNGNICDARFSKCCGGALEEFQYCWEDVKHSYLNKQRDSKSEIRLPNLHIETEAEKWIRTAPQS